MNWQEIWEKIKAWFISNTWNIAWFFIALIAGIIVIKIILMVVKRIMRARKVDEMAIRFIAAILRFLLWLILVLVLLSIMGVPVTGVTAAFSAAVLAVGMALKDFLANLASGIVLIGSKKYKTGDYVKVGAVDGCVVDINFLFTTLKTFDSTQVTLPNSTMVNSPVTNFGAYRLRRVAITFTVAYESDTRLVKETLLHVMSSCSLVHTNPAPACDLKAMNESSLEFFCRCYCDNEDYWDTYFYVMDHGFEECKRVGIVFPFKQIELTNKTRSPMPLAYPDGLVDQPKKDHKEEEVKGMTMEEWEDFSIAEMSARFKKQAEQDKARKAKEAKKAESSQKKGADKKKSSAPKQKEMPVKSEKQDEKKETKTKK